MYRSFHVSYLILCFSLAAVFLWFGIDKFINPNYWLLAWVPQWFLGFLEKINLDPIKFIYINGAFEMLVGVALISGILRRFFAVLGAFFLIGVIANIGFNEISVRDIGLLGGLLAIITWPTNQSLNF